MMSQFDMNQVGRTGGIDVKAEDIDITIGEDMVCQLNMNQVGTLLHSCRTGPVGKLLFKKMILLVDEKGV